MPFPVSCPACGKSFSIADDAYEQKIKGRVVSVKCKQCQGLIRVDGTKPPEASARTSTPAEPAPSFLVDTPGGTDRELSATQIAEEFRAGHIDETTLVWREGMAEWTEAGKVAELEPFLKSAEPQPQAADPSRKIRPMQPTLPMGMMAPPSLAARGITLPLSPPTGSGSTPETVSVPLETRLPTPRERDDAAPVRPKPPSQPRAAAEPRSAPKAAGSSPMAAPPKAAGSSPLAAQKPPSAPRAVPIPTPLPRSRPSASLSAQVPTFAEPEPAPAADPFAGAPPPVIPPYAPPSAFPAQAPVMSAQPPAASNFPGQPRAGSAFPTSPAPASAIPAYGSYGPPAASPAPKLPDSFPAAAPIDDLDFQPKRSKAVFIVIGVAVVAAIVVALLASGGESPKPVPVPTVLPTAESRPYAPAPTPTPAPAPTPSPTSASPDPLLNPNAAPGAPQNAAAPNTGNEFTDLFAQGAKKLGTARPAPSAAPQSPPSPLDPPAQ
jgi:hypothetical protein